FKTFSACLVMNLLLLLLLEITSSAGDSNSVNPCCYYPCQHAGVCVRYGTDQYQCDCTGTGFYGDNCTVPEFWTNIYVMLKPSPPLVHFILKHFQWFWDFVNNSFLQDVFMRFVLTVRIKLIPIIPTYNTKYGYLNWESYYNTSYYTRILPPVPEDCPLPMGAIAIHTHTHRPFETLDNMLFCIFTHRETCSSGSWHSLSWNFLHLQVDGSNIYGDNLMRQLQLRLLKDGKLKYQLVNGEMYPPTVNKVSVYMMYPETVPPEQRLVIGHELFGLVPGLSLYATLWLREHNRVCDILKEEHPTWDDEQLFQTARLIVIGETIKIIIEDYVQHLSGYLFKLKFDPSLLFKEQFQYSNRIALEFVHLYHWHSLMPDSFLIDGDDISLPEFLYNSSILTHYGVEKLVDSFSRQRAGQV
uniref:Prostaglandin G/H synthase 1 n=1 Tax=Tetraodon nigroviridis TaxID=99883 RepID=H3DDR9_TETNG